MYWSTVSNEELIQLSEDITRQMHIRGLVPRTDPTVTFNGLTLSKLDMSLEQIMAAQGIVDHEPPYNYLEE